MRRSFKRLSLVLIQKLTEYEVQCQDDYISSMSYKDDPMDHCGVTKNAFLLKIISLWSGNRAAQMIKLHQHCLPTYSRYLLPILVYKTQSIRNLLSHRASPIKTPHGSGLSWHREVRFRLFDRPSEIKGSWLNVNSSN